MSILKRLNGIYIIYIIHTCLMNDTLVTVFPNGINRTCENHCCVKFINVLRVTRNPFVYSNHITALQLRTCLPLIGYCQVLSAWRKVKEKSFSFNMIVLDNDGHNWNVLLISYIVYYNVMHSTVFSHPARSLHVGLIFTFLHNWLIFATTRGVIAI